MQAMLNTAITAARKAGNIIARGIDKLDTIKVTMKNNTDFVTEIDQQAEAVIIDTIRHAYPSHGIIAEESGTIDGDEYTWIIDPLDGTTNFTRGFPHVAVSIALQHHGKLCLGLVFDPLRNELFTTIRGKGAQLNNHRIRVSTRNSLQYALLGTGFPFRNRNKLPIYLQSFETIFTNCAGIRRAGAAALDLAYVAAGRLDGFWELDLKPWDIAAGALLIKEAGGLVGDCNGTENYLQSGNIVAGNAKVFKAILQNLKPHL